LVTNESGGPTPGARGPVRVTQVIPSAVGSTPGSHPATLAGVGVGAI